jgi:dihydrofolate reductase
MSEHGRSGSGAERATDEGSNGARPNDATDGSSDGEGDIDIDIVLVAAVAENGVIGQEGEMPWHYPADLAQFKQLTMGHPVVLGRRTYEAIVAGLGEPLPGRTSVVLTRSGLEEVPESVVVAGSVAEAVAAADRAAAALDVATAYVVGGAAVYQQFLPRADRLRITEVPESPEGDTYFPAFDDEEWIEIERESTAELAFVTYKRR